MQKQPRMPDKPSWISRWASGDEARQAAAYERLERSRRQRRWVATVAVVAVLGGVLAVASYLAFPPAPGPPAQRYHSPADSQSRITAVEAGAVELEVREGKQSSRYRLEKARQGWLLREISPYEPNRHQRTADPSRPPAPVTIPAAPRLPPTLPAPLPPTSTTTP